MEGLKARLEQAENEAKEAEYELAATNAKADATEEEVKTIMDEINALEDELDGSESKMTSVESNLHSSVKKLDEVQRAKGVLIARNETETELRERLESELAALTEQNDNVEKTLAAISNDIDELEASLDAEDERANNADNRVKQLEIEVLVVGNNLRTMEISEDQTNVRDTEHTQKIAELTAKLETAQEKALKFEALQAELERNQDELEQKLTDEKENYNSTKRDLDLTLAEIQEMNI